MNIAENMKLAAQLDTKRYAAYSRASMQRHPERRKARVALGHAVRDGRVQKKPCAVCGETKRVHGHHDDYSKPLDVVWLCAKHHGERHRRFDATGRWI